MDKWYDEAVTGATEGSDSANGCLWLWPLGLIARLFWILTSERERGSLRKNTRRVGVFINHVLNTLAFRASILILIYVSALDWGILLHRQVVVVIDKEKYFNLSKVHLSYDGVEFAS
ncbi:hypothetical protein J6590_033076 [Homalodisca vitripennis]|nr:hypothetical protein J6590_033076 [Homalodisca vitripennis]